MSVGALNKFESFMKADGRMVFEKIGEDDELRNGEDEDRERRRRLGISRGHAMKNRYAKITVG